MRSTAPAGSMAATGVVVHSATSVTAVAPAGGRYLGTRVSGSGALQLGIAVMGNSLGKGLLS